MRARDMRPTPAMLTSLFNSCANNDENRHAALAQATNLYEQMKVHGWDCGGITYHAMLKVFAMQGDSSTCFRVSAEDLFQMQFAFVKF